MASIHEVVQGMRGGRLIATLLDLAEADVVNDQEVGLAAIDDDGRQTYVSPAFCRMVGSTRDELIVLEMTGKSIRVEHAQAERTAEGASPPTNLVTPTNPPIHPIPSATPTAPGRTRTCSWCTRYRGRSRYHALPR